MSDIDERLEEEILHASRKSFDSQQAGINANFLMDIQREIERLRADLAAVTAERDMMREVLKAERERAYNEGRASRRAVVAAGHALFIYAQKAGNKIKRHSLEKLLPSPDDELLAFIRASPDDELLAFIRAVGESSKSDSVRAALEDVTEPPR